MNDFTPPSLAGQQLAQYRIGERLGAGGMGEVYRAEDTRLGRDRGGEGAARGPDLSGRTRPPVPRGARRVGAALARTSPRSTTSASTGARPFIVMELVAGERCRRG